jgi:hypothetical protein
VRAKTDDHHIEFGVRNHIVLDGIRELSGARYLAPEQARSSLATRFSQ